MKHVDALRVSGGKGLALCGITAAAKTADIILRNATGVLVDNGADGAAFFAALPVIGAVCGINLLLQYLAPYAQDRYEASYTGALFSRLEEKVLLAKQEQLDNRNVGEFTTCFTSDIPGILQYTKRMLLFLFPDILSFALCLSLLARMNPVLALTALVSAMASAFFMTKLSAGMVKGLNAYQDKLKDVNKMTSDSLFNLEMVKISQMEEGLKKRYADELNRLHRIRRQVALRQAVLSAPTMTLSFVTLLAIVLCGGYFVLTGRMRIGQLLSAAALSDYIVSPVMRFENSLVQCRRATVHLKNFSLFEKMEEEGQAVLGVKAASACGFWALSFRYPGGKPVFDGLELRFEKGKLHYIVGANGCGKSTFFQIIGGIYEIDSGEIYLPAKSDSRKDVRAAISVMPQEPLLFADSVRANLLAGTTGREEDMVRMCRELGLHEEIQGMEAGYDTVLHENGAPLSGGQKKRLTFIRCVLREAAVYLFDEPTANVDAQNAARMMAMLGGLAKERCVVVITHDRELTEKYPGTVHALSGGGTHEK